MELLVAVVSAVLLGGETLHTEEYIGGALILSATLLEAFSSSEEEIHD
jgi:drug/metabolite transporter (DMT)-like permease